MRHWQYESKTTSSLPSETVVGDIDDWRVDVLQGGEVASRNSKLGLSSVKQVMCRSLGHSPLLTGHWEGASQPTLSPHTLTLHLFH
jgi:hypothetical protein